MTRIRLSALALVISSCAISAREGTNSTPLPTGVAYVAPNGDDTASGAVGSPYRTIAHALSLEDVGQIVLAVGVYAEREVTLARRVELKGPENGEARIDGHLRISANDVHVSQLAVTRGVVIGLAKNVYLEKLAIDPGNLEDALAISSAEARLNDLKISCGSETCIQVTTSRVAMHDTKLSASGAAKRGLRVETSSVTAERLFVEGTTINQVIGLGGAYLKLTDLELINAAGVGLAAMKGAVIEGDRIAVRGASRGAVLIQSSHAVIKDLSVERSDGSAVAIAGGDLELSNPQIASGGDAGITINSHLDHDPIVRLFGGNLEHTKQPAILLGQGDLTIQGTRIHGSNGSNDDESDSIIANGPSSFLRFLEGTIESPGGFGITLTRDASATITATIVNPRIGGVFVEDVAAGSVAISGTIIKKCGSGTGIVVQDATDVSIRSTTVNGCAEAGLLAGQTSIVSVAGSDFAKNAQYGIAAFGGATITVENTTASGSRWATFATCGDGASIDDAGKNHFNGQTTACP